ncbi:MFS transporter [Peptoniphilus harei]|uniref:Arabinose efflux permease n=1 Tax=Peptoniphilus harei TaxID=54005 RepID=A0A2X1ZTY2_9FIRM|nr:MFS transporter [Peptoniphilus harei]SPY47625.1 Arabinose efflux permease [Peptoniphilus harei]
MHISKNFTGLGGSYGTFRLISEETLPLLYAGAMLVDAVAALVFGHIYDKKGVRALVISTIISAPFSLFIFGFKSELALLFGLVLWGIGMGAQESILKAAVTSMVPKKNRATGYGIFECSFGIFWFLGSWILGVIYSKSLPLMIGLSIFAQVLAIPFYLKASREI